ncbi:MAG: permease [Anaerolineales bacterium]|nr:MAG: permease [Anaerolineales bacterium]
MKRVFNTLSILGLAVLGVALVLFLQNWMSGTVALPGQFFTFTTIFLGIFIEAAPFLLLGTLASGFVEVFFRKEAIQRIMPRNRFVGALAGGLLGFVFPVCECGVVPLTRRLFRKGMAPAMGVAFLLASPVLNPIVILSTFAAYGWGPVLWLRIGLSLVIAVSTGLIFAVEEQPERLLRPRSLSLAPIRGASVDLAMPVYPGSLGSRVRRALSIAGEEFFEMGRYLIIGSMLAAALQAVVPQGALLALGSGPLLSVLVMMLLAVLLSICSTVDSFVSLAFVGTFTTGSILSFLVFGPMVDIKNILLYMQVFRRRTVLYMVIVPALMVILATVFINLNLGI